MTDSQIDRFWSQVDRSGPCWLWTGTFHEEYGAFGRLRAHRVSYELTHGPIPAGLQIDHLCRNTRCVRPDHLEVVTSRENTLRGFSQWGINARKTACRNGHPLDPTNIYTAPGTQKRDCRQCRYESDRQYKSRNIRDSDLSTLDRALDLDERFGAGIFPVGGGQYRHFQRLVRRGWLVFDNYGFDIDGERDDEVPIYKLTPQGRAIVSRRDEARREREGTR